jgi:hypothetical protein
MIRQTAGLVAAQIGGGVGVAADVRLSFNGRASRQFTNPDVVISGTDADEPIPGFIAASPAG